MTNLIVDDIPEDPPPAADLSPAEQAIAGLVPTAGPGADDFTPAVDEFPIESLPERWQDEIRSLRKESGDRRAQVRPYEDAFAEYDEDTKSALLEWIRLAPLADNGDAAAQARLDELFGGGDDPASAQAQPVAAPELTEERLAQLVAEQVAAQMGVVEQQRQQQEAVRAVADRAREWGYEPGNGQDVLPSEDYLLLMGLANRPDFFNNFDDPMAEAHKHVQSYKQQIISAHLNAKGDQAAGTPPVATPGTSAAPNTAQLPYDPNASTAAQFRGARESLIARLEQRG